ncbi:hypothetical protein ACOT8F_01000 [Metabacillus sp. RGM 3146]
MKTFSLPFDHFHFFNASSSDLKHEYKKTDEFIRKHGEIDVLLHGVGVNGHLGLNEPYVSFDLNSHVIELIKQQREWVKKFQPAGKRHYDWH